MQMQTKVAPAAYKLFVHNTIPASTEAKYEYTVCEPIVIRSDPNNYQG